MKKIRLLVALILMLGILAMSGLAEVETIDINSLKYLGIPIHIIELFLALFISFMSLKFFRITRPTNIFIYVYLALGFFIIDTLLYLVFYLGDLLGIDINFANVYVASRLSLIAMLIVFVTIFYYIHRIMTAKVDSSVTTLDKKLKNPKK